MLLNRVLIVFLILAGVPAYAMLIKAPDTAENGAVIPVDIKLSTPMSAGQRLDLLVNGELAVQVRVVEGRLSGFSTRVKGSQSNTTITARVIANGSAIDSATYNINVGVPAQASGSPTIVGGVRERKLNGEIILLMQSENGFAGTLVLQDTGFRAEINGSSVMPKNPFIGVKGEFSENLTATIHGQVSLAVTPSPAAAKAAASAASARAAGAWAKDSTKGCLFLDEGLKPNETATWTGSCVDGKAQGAGEIVRYLDGIPSGTIPITGENGLTMVAGELKIKVPPSDVRFELTFCGSPNGYRKASAFVKNDLALWNEEIAIIVLNMAGEFVANRCPSGKGMHLASVRIYYGGEQPADNHNDNAQVQAVYKNGKWNNVSNKAYRSFMASQQERYSALLAKRQAELNARERAVRETEERERTKLQMRERAAREAQEARKRELAKNADQMDREMDKEFDAVVKRYASGNLPSEAYAEQVFKNENRRWIKEGLLYVDSFKKTDGQKMSAFGVDYYNLEYEAVVSFSKGTNAPCIKWEVGKFYQCGIGNENVSPSGQPVRVSGKIPFDKTENGWRFESH